MRQLSSKGVIQDFADNVVIKSGNELRAKYAKDIVQFLQKYDLDNAAIAELKQTATERKAEWKDEDFVRDAAILNRSVKALITTYIWNTSPEFVESYVENKEVEKAVQLFPEAMKIARAK